MSIQTLSSIAFVVVEQHHQAGRDLVEAYKSGVEQAGQAFNRRLAGVGEADVLPQSLLSPFVVGESSDYLNFLSAKYLK